MRGCVGQVLKVTMEMQQKRDLSPLASALEVLFPCVHTRKTLCLFPPLIFPPQTKAEMIAETAAKNFEVLSSKELLPKGRLGPLC